MRSLFLKIFLWFWATQIVTAFALIITFVVQSGGVPARWHQGLVETARSYGVAASHEMQRGGPSAAGAYLARLQSEARITACLYDQNGNQLAGADCGTFASLLRRSSPPEIPAFTIWHGMARVRLRVPGATPYIFVTELPAGPRAALGPDLSTFAGRLAVALLVSGFICYLLTRYLTGPILQLRAASRKLASGTLSTRAPAHAIARHDELGELVRDFNSMAEQIEALVSSQRQLISDVSHELRSPLARLTVALDLARKRKGDDPAFERMEKDFDRLGEMLGRLLTVARLDASSAAIEMTPVNLSALVADVVEDAEFEAGNHNRKVSLSREGNITIRGNAGLLRSAIENIIRNALRYTAEGTSVEVSLRSEKDNSPPVAILRVRDYGPGVPEAELKNIFRPFYRVANARDRQSGGIGLGLAIADRVARIHAGSLRAANAEGGGLQVEARFPNVS